MNGLGQVDVFLPGNSPAQRPMAPGVDRLSLASSLAASVEPSARPHDLVAAVGNVVAGAWQLARAAAESASDLAMSRCPL